MTNELDQPTPGPWRWKFLSTAGNYFLLGNDGNGPITHDTPTSADGRLKQAAPALLAALEPFAACADIWEGEDPKRVIHMARRGVKGLPDLIITVGDLLAAAVAMAEAKG